MKISKVTIPIHLTSVIRTYGSMEIIINLKESCSLVSYQIFTEKGVGWREIARIVKAVLAAKKLE